MLDFSDMLFISNVMEKMFTVSYSTSKCYIIIPYIELCITDNDVIELNDTHSSYVYVRQKLKTCCLCNKIKLVKGTSCIEIIIGNNETNNRKMLSIIPRLCCETCIQSSGNCNIEYKLQNVSVLKFWKCFVQNMVADIDTLSMIKEKEEELQSIFSEMSRKCQYCNQDVELVNYEMDVYSNAEQQQKIRETIDMFLYEFEVQDIDVYDLIINPRKYIGIIKDERTNNFFCVLEHLSLYMWLKIYEIEKVYESDLFPEYEIIQNKSFQKRLVPKEWVFCSNTCDTNFMYYTEILLQKLYFTYNSRVSKNKEVVYQIHHNDLVQYTNIEYTKNAYLSTFIDRLWKKESLDNFVKNLDADISQDTQNEIIQELYVLKPIFYV